MSDLILSGRFAVKTISEITSLPPFFKTRYTSSKTLSLFGDKLMTQFEIITSTEPAATGKVSYTISNFVISYSAHHKSSPQNIYI